MKIDDMSHKMGCVNYLHNLYVVKVKAKCLNPRNAWKCGTRVCKDGVVGPNIVFSQKEAIKYFVSVYGDLEAGMQMELNRMEMPCGKCKACVLQKRKDWTTRISHEMEMHDCDFCCMVTLTYDENNVPFCRDVESPVVRRSDISFTDGYSRTLLPRDVQLFMKRLRRWLDYVPCKKSCNRDHLESGNLRYFAVGEYGSKTGRPHYHILLFGWCPSDLEYFFTRNGHEIFRSKQIEQLWTLGYSTVQRVGVGCAKYVARYVSKKFGDDAVAKEGKRIPEFYLQSCRNGGIGSLYFDAYWSWIIEHNFVSVRSTRGFYKQSIPSYYIRRLRKMHPDFYVKFRDERIAFFEGKILDRDKDTLERVIEASEYRDKVESMRDFF